MLCDQTHSLPPCSSPNDGTVEMGLGLRLFGGTIVGSASIKLLSLKVPVCACTSNQVVKQSQMCAFMSGSNMTDDTVSGIKDRANEGRERGTKQIVRAWCLVSSAWIVTILIWLSVLVTSTGTRNHVNHACCSCLSDQTENQSTETPCPARMKSLIYTILHVPVTDASLPVWTTNTKRSVDVKRK